MTGNIALDVVIGLVFIYLLYSLFTTILLEMLASLFSLRARNLSFAIQRMLCDEKETNPIKMFLLRILTSLTSIFGISLNLRKTYLYSKFYKQPSIKYLASGAISKKPSYLHATNFSKVLMEILSEGSQAQAPLDKIKEGIARLPEDSETKKYLESLLAEANNDLQKFRILAENWFDTTMERCIGWYKRNTQLLLLILGFIIAVSLNISTIDLIKKLSRDDDARKQMVELSSAYIQGNPGYIDYLTQEQKTTPKEKRDSIALARLDSLMAINRMLKMDIDKAAFVLSMAWPDTVKYKSGRLDALRKSINKPGFIYPKMADEKLFKAFVLKPRTNNDPKEEYSYRWFVFWKSFWGYVLTALAISVGAPFWFDLLNKLVKLRGSISTASADDSGKNKNDQISPLDRKG